MGIAVNHSGKAQRFPFVPFATSTREHKNRTHSRQKRPNVILTDVIAEINGGHGNHGIVSLDSANDLVEPTNGVVGLAIGLDLDGSAGIKVDVIAINGLHLANDSHILVVERLEQGAVDSCRRWQTHFVLVLCVCVCV